MDRGSTEVLPRGGKVLLLAGKLRYTATRYPEVANGGPSFNVIVTILNGFFRLFWGWAGACVWKGRPALRTSTDDRVQASCLVVVVCTTLWVALVFIPFVPNTIEQFFLAVEPTERTVMFGTETLKMQRRLSKSWTVTRLERTIISQSQSRLTSAGTLKLFVPYGYIP